MDDLREFAVFRGEEEGGGWGGALSRVDALNIEVHFLSIDAQRMEQQLAALSRLEALGFEQYFYHQNRHSSMHPHFGVRKSVPCCYELGYVRDAPRATPGGAGGAGGAGSWSAPVMLPGCYTAYVTLLALALRTSARMRALVRIADSQKGI